MTNHYREQFTWAFDPAVGVVVAGGNNDGGRGANLDSVYRTKDGVTFDTLPTLYERIEAGCMAIIDDDEVLHFGGNYHAMKCLGERERWKIFGLCDLFGEII